MIWITCLLTFFKITSNKDENFIYLEFLNIVIYDINLINNRIIIKKPVK